MCMCVGLWIFHFNFLLQTVLLPGTNKEGVGAGVHVKEMGVLSVGPKMLVAV